MPFFLSSMRAQNTEIILARRMKNKKNKFPKYTFTVVFHSLFREKLNYTRKQKTFVMLFERSLFLLLCWKVLELGNVLMCFYSNLSKNYSEELP